MYVIYHKIANLSFKEFRARKKKYIYIYNKLETPCFLGGKRKCYTEVMTSITVAVIGPNI